ncbi:efflux RND transporter periplasmic adaptor subunit [Pseudoalteromonas denitrificans]|uniref:RND family efflux transporter, MFP subunit n=1 Tax=Pseudoalteromonas denitrificans DSM 6059 TaxID=1123010 RepID=A0A1I1P115_9GAMM|nr:efflux RND transporter periplasmic adaptor subunit [Pseudoalteromonas denitrificans]SFD00653.1 RND family efflux transporter, MFP subunit [Pseudoalteromonas denitrificans DSM 6059]
MNRILIGVLLLCLQACSEQVKQEKTQEPIVVQLFETKRVDVSSEYEFPATVSAVKSVDLKFEVSGRLIFENLVEGSPVAKGDVLARIDSAPFERQVSEAKIRYEDAVRNLARIEEVFKKNVASQSTFDDAKSQYAITELALANAKQDLSYTTIKAPFDAVVGARLIENNSYISAGDTIANLQDRSKLYFTFDVPERVMTANAGNRNIKATAHIIGQEDNIFDITYVEHETSPNPITQTYGVTFALDGKVSNLFYPGSRASVKIENMSEQHSAILIPIKSLMGDKNKGFKVWKFNPEMNNVQAAPVEIASLQGEFAVVSSGVNVGDKIVSAAVNQMSKGLKVKEYKAEY